jgi:hypothetical protein
MEMMTEHHKAKPNSVYWSSRNEEYEYLLGVSDQVIYLVKNKQVYQLGCGLVAETREIEMGPEPDPRIFYLRYQQRLLGKQVTSPGMRGKTDQCKATAEILAEMDTCVDAGCRLLYAWRWVGQEPLSVEARLRLADNLLKLDLLPLAVREYEQVLVLEADNMTARIKLGELEAVPRLPEEL